MNTKELSNIACANIREAARIAARDGRLDNWCAKVAVNATVRLGAAYARDAAYTPDGRVRPIADEPSTILAPPTADELFTVWVPRGTVSGRFHRAVDGTGRESSVVVWGGTDEWEFAGKLYVGRKTAGLSFPLEISRVSAEVSVYDAPLAVVKERMAADAAIMRAARCRQYGL